MPDQQHPHPSLEKLSAFDAGRLRDAEWEEIEQHVARCGPCCRELEALPADRLAVLLRVSMGKSASSALAGFLQIGQRSLMGRLRGIVGLQRSEARL